MHLTNNQLKGIFGTTIFMRGLEYHHDGLVELLVSGEDHVEAIVDGTEAYSIEVDRNGKNLSFYCSCPFDGPCKHIAATLLQAREEAEENEDQLSFYHPKVATPAWQTYFQQMGAGEISAQQSKPTWRMIYVIGLETNNWWLSPKKQKLKNNGDWGAPRSPDSADYTNTSVLSEEDKLVLGFLDKWRMSSNEFYFYYSSYSRNSKYDLDFGAQVGIVFDHLREGLILHQHNDKLLPVQFADAKDKIEFRLNKTSDDRYSFAPYLLQHNKETALCGNFKLLTTQPTWLLQNETLIEVTGEHEAASLLPFAKPGYKLNISKKDLPLFINSLAAKPTLFDSFILPDAQVKKISEITEKRLYIEEIGDSLNIHLKFLYETVEVGYEAEPTSLWGLDETEEGFLKIFRDQEAESEAFEQLTQTKVKCSSGGRIQTYKNKALPWLLEDVPKLLQHGFSVFGEEQLKQFKVSRIAPQVSVQVSSGIDWFDLKVEIDVGGVLLSLKELKKAIKHKQQYVKLADGRIATLPKAWLNRFRHAINLGEEQSDKLRFSSFHATLIDELFVENELEHDDDQFAKKLAQLREFKSIRPQVLPKKLKANLRPYQKEGYNWLHFLKEFHFGGCLADDMGLGKTVQALSILVAEVESGVQKPNLIVAPTSVIFNWIEEIARFAPHMRVLDQTGSDRQRTDIDFQAFNIVLTSYGTLRRDILFLRDIDFHYVVLDESQNIKNPVSQTAKAAKLVKAQHRLALTGTPIENNTIELWSLFSFLNPGLLGAVTYFKEAFAKPIEKDQDKDAAKLLKKIVFPFILRRTKEKVAPELPPKVESMIYAEMGPQQMDLYNRWRDYYRAALLKQIDDVGLNKSRMNVLEGLTKLRQIACHPLLVESKFNGVSKKYELLLEHIEEIKAEGHNMLIFSQFVRMLTIIRNYLDSANINYAYLDGKTRDRKACVEQFQQNADCRIFLISLKAGGTGLNLTSADYVIHYDPWWNPAVEAQATDRSHRIGQNKHVFVHKMITKNTVEEKILKLQERKKKLVDKLVSTDTGLFKTLTVEDLQDLFS